MNIYDRFCWLGVGYITGVFLLNYFKNVKFLRKKRLEMRENAFEWHVFDDFSFYSEPIMSSSVISLLARAPLTGNVASFNGNFVTSFYHEVMWNDWHIC